MYVFVSVWKFSFYYIYDFYILFLLFYSILEEQDLGQDHLGNVP